MRHIPLAVTCLTLAFLCYDFLHLPEALITTLASGADRCPYPRRLRYGRRSGSEPWRFLTGLNSKFRRAFLLKILFFYFLASFNDVMSASVFIYSLPDKLVVIQLVNKIIFRIIFLKI